MKPPFFAIDDGDVLVFRSASDLERYIESPDASAYSIFDAEGLRLSLESPLPDQKSSRWAVDVSPVRLVCPTIEGYGRYELIEILKNFLSRNGHSEAAKLGDLSDLVVAVQNSDLFTR